MAPTSAPGAGPPAGGVLLRSAVFTGAEGAGGGVRLVGQPLRPGDDDEGYFLSEDRFDENPVDERVHFWSWFAAVSPGTLYPTWLVESWSAEPAPSPAAPGGELWHLVEVGTIETQMVSFEIVISDEMFSSTRIVHVTSQRTGIRVHLVELGGAREREDAWFDRQEVLGWRGGYPPEIPGYDVNPVLLQVWPA